LGTPSTMAEVEEVRCSSTFLQDQMTDIVQLVQRLYLPGSPALISKTQETLQRLQRSPEGWQLGDALLSSNDEKVRFFGALTFTVKLNADW